MATSALRASCASMVLALAVGSLQGYAATPPAPPKVPAPPAPPPPPPGLLANPTRVERVREPLSAGSKLWVRNRNGSIRVQAWDKEEVALVAEIRDSERRKVDLVVQRKGADLDIEALFQNPGWHMFGFGGVQQPRCELSLSVPRRILGHFRTTNGTVAVVGVEGYARCETTNGDVRLKDLAGEVLATTTNGTVEALRLKARLKGGTTNGKVVLEDVDGGVDMETTNGSIRARNLDGWGEGIRLETTNGSMDVELGRAAGSVEANNTNGSLDVKVPQAQGLDQTKHSVRFKVPGRSQKIRLETTNGSIRLR